MRVARFRPTYWPTPEKVENLQMGDLEYTGTVLFGRRNGFGTAYYKDGARYQGMWVNDLREGSGK